MNLTIIGSTGRTGRHLVRHALDAGHAVTAFTRRPESLPDQSKLAAVVAGDGRDPTAVQQAIRGQDAIIAILGATSRNGPHQSAEVARTLINVMKTELVTRLVVTSAYPIIATTPRIPMAILKLIFAGAYADHRAMERLISDSDLDWTIVRFNRLTDNPVAGPLRMTCDLLDRPSSLSRADAATALLQILTDPALHQSAVNIAGP